VWAEGMASYWLCITTQWYTVPWYTAFCRELSILHTHFLELLHLHIDAIDQTRFCEDVTDNWWQQRLSQTSNTSR